jgi:hypothetical protein
VFFAKNALMHKNKKLLLLCYFGNIVHRRAERKSWVAEQSKFKRTVSRDFSFLKLNRISTLFKCAEVCSEKAYC